MLVAPRIVNDVSYVTDINHENHFSWQAQHLVTLECDACCSACCCSVFGHAAVSCPSPDLVRTC